MHRDTDFHEIADADIWNQQRRCQPAIEGEAFHLRLAAEQFKCARRRLLNLIFAPNQPNGMHLEPLISWVELHRYLRDALGTLARQDTLDAPEMPGELRPT
jgi:hypothetical protein